MNPDQQPQYQQPPTSPPPPPPVPDAAAYQQQYQPAPAAQQPAPAIKNPLSAMREGESVLFEIRRHPMGLFGIYFSFGSLLALVAIGAVLAPNILTDYSSRTVSNIGLFLFLGLAILSLIFVVLARWVYYGNRWVLTSDSLTQVTQMSIFNKNSAQLGMDNLEDVTVEQRGILAHIFNYGTLKSQTSGEQGKYQLTYTPRPHEHAQQILLARENFEHGDNHVNK